MNSFFEQYTEKQISYSVCLNNKTLSNDNN